MSYGYLDSPLGRLLAFSDAGHLTGLYFPAHRRGRLPSAGDARRDMEFDELSKQLSEYFGGHRREFDLDYCLAGTPFQLAVWSALASIPCGSTVSYSELAASVGAPRAVRAVASAVARNPISIVVPCHRVVGTTGALTGYAGGIDAKRQLLAIEARCGRESADELIAVNQVKP